MSRCAEMVDIQCHILRDTGEAILISVDDVKHWIPLSQVDRTTRLNGITTVRMTAWIARTKNII